MHGVPQRTFTQTERAVVATVVLRENEPCPCLSSARYDGERGACLLQEEFGLHGTEVRFNIRSTSEDNPYASKGEAAPEGTASKTIRRRTKGQTPGEGVRLKGRSRE
jgi:hypothetical protein